VLTELVNLYKISHTRLFDEIPKSIQSCETLVVELANYEIIDAKFVDDEYVLLLVQPNVDAETSSLIKLPFNLQSGKSFKYTTVGKSVKDMTLLKGGFPAASPAQSIEDWEDDDSIVLETFHHKDDSIKPIGFTVTGRKNRKACVVMGEDSRQVRIYDLNATKDVSSDAKHDSDVEMS
jgi:hypothetical protein